MELAVAPLGEDLLGGLGEHLRKACEYPGRAPTPRPGLATLGAVGDGGTAGMAACGGPLEWPGRVSGRALCLETVACRVWLGQQPSAGGSRRVDRGKRVDRNEYVNELIFYVETEERGPAAWPPHFLH
jgi:hypothetical protein